MLDKFENVKKFDSNFKMIVLCNPPEDYYSVFYYGFKLLNTMPLSANILADKEFISIAISSFISVSQSASRYEDIKEYLDEDLVKSAIVEGFTVHSSSILLGKEVDEYLSRNECNPSVIHGYAIDVNRETPVFSV